MYQLPDQMKAAAQAQYERDIVRVKGAQLPDFEQLHAALRLASTKLAARGHCGHLAVAEDLETSRSTDDAPLYHVRSGRNGALLVMTSW